MTSINLVLIALFICVSVPVVKSVSKQNRWKILLAVNLLFYFLLIGSKILIILALAGITYSFGRFNQSRRSYFLISLILLIVPLIIYKTTTDRGHFEKIQHDPNRVFDTENWYAIFQIIGLSYFTFNSISYLIDIRRKYLIPEKNFFFLLSYLVYFPAVFSGPLHRAKYLFEQFKNIEISNESVSKGLRLILWGLFKNTVIAQRLLDLIISLQASEIGGFYHLVTGLCFFFYLYCNFSSFIDFFQGVSQLFNIRLRDNFSNRVYLSSSRQEFWKGWHITLNEWFRDYFFFVISGFDKKRKFTDVFLLITFLLIALWHEFSPALIIWGTFNGIWIITERKIAFQKWPFLRFRKISGVFYHLSISSLMALIFISPEQSLLFEKVILDAPRFSIDLKETGLLNPLIILFCLGIMDFHYLRAKDRRFDDYLEAQPKLLRWVIYLKLTFLILGFGIGSGIENYYIQF